MRLVIDGRPVEFQEGENLLVTMLRADMHPTGGGCLCFGGDCHNCLASVDGVAYVRTCQTKAQPAMVVAREHFQHAHPPMPTQDHATPDKKARNIHCDVVVVRMDGEGQSEIDTALQAGKSVFVVDADHEMEPVAVYAGPLVVARTPHELLLIHPHEEIIVATGAAEIQPVVEGSHLSGLLNSSACSKLAQAGLELGRVVAIGTPPQGVAVHQFLQGELVRFEGESKVQAVIVRDADGNETRVECDTVSLGLGIHPRDTLALMGNGLPVRTVGKATAEATLPTCPDHGIICPCIGTSRADLDFTWDSGFHELELIKRASLAGTGVCQGMTCLPYVRSFIQEKSGTLQPRFTARPVTRQITLEEIAAGAHHRSMGETALHHEHVALGAQMEHFGHWWRPWTYGNPDEEYWAAREAVGIMDVSTLGKMIVSGPDALEFLERLYPTQVATIKPGRTRYVLILNERGYVFDDGLVAKETDTRYALTFTSGGSSHAEMWLRDWATTWGMDVRILNQTYTLGAINVTGPLTHELLRRAGMTHPLKYMEFADVEVCGIACRVYRLSFTGEVSFELHHLAKDSVTLWRNLMSLGRNLGIKPHGLETLLKLRLEKGHIIVGQDTDFDSTPRRIRHEWAIKPEKPFFVGRTSLLRTNRIELDKVLTAFEMEGNSPHEGAVIWHQGHYAGYVTSSTWSPALQKGIMMGWLYYFNGELPTEVMIEDRVAQRVELPFYDKEGIRARA